MHRLIAALLNLQVCRIPLYDITLEVGIERIGNTLCYGYAARIPQRGAPRHAHNNIILASHTIS